MTGTFLAATGWYVEAGLRASSAILARRDLLYPSALEELSACARALGSIHERDFMRQIVQWLRACDPEFDHLCRKTKQLTVERDQAAARLEQLTQAAGLGPRSSR